MFRRFRVARLCRSRCCGTSVGRMLEVALSGPSPSVVVDDVAAFVDLEYGLELAVDDHVHGLRKCRRKVYLDAEITLSNQVEATAIAGVRCQIETEEGVSITEVFTCQFVAFILGVFTRGGEQIDVASHVAPVLEVWLERFGRHLTSVDVDSQEVYGVVLGVERFFVAKFPL